MSAEHELNPAEHVTELEAAQAGDPAIGTGTAAARPGEPGAAPHEPPPTTLLERQPAATIGTVIAVADAILVAAVPLPEWLTAVLVAVVTVGGALGIRSKVTPTAAPRLDADTPLTP
jgi:hypothetical protein